MASVNLIAHAQRMLVDADTKLLILAEQVGKGARQGLDGETVMLMTKISREIQDAVRLLFDSEGAAGSNPPLQ